MDVLCPSSLHDVPLQYQIRVTCNKGTRNTREARLVGLSDGLKLMINEAAGRVLVKPYAPGLDRIIGKLRELPIR